MICAKFAWTWPSDFGEDENMNGSQTQTDRQ